MIIYFWSTLIKVKFVKQYMKMFKLVFFLKDIELGPNFDTPLILGLFDLLGGSVIFVKYQKL